MKSLPRAEFSASFSSSSTRTARHTVQVQQQALDALAEALADEPLSSAFEQAVATIASTQGRVIVTGMGKSGLIGRKIAATLTSTGTPSSYLHPSEASHGDLGMITGRDVLLMLSWSGETSELSDIMAYSRRLGVPQIVMTSDANSTAGRAADICLALPRVREACPNQLAPTCSTTMQLVLGDALAVVLIEARGFSAEDFRTFHPGGRLGALLVTVGHLMATGDAVPAVREDVTLLDATIEMSRKRYGCTAIVNSAGELLGAFTDGDLRRTFAANAIQDVVSAHMTPRPLSVPPCTLSSAALRVMNENAVSALFVCEGEKLVGVVHLHDILRAGVA